MNPYKNNRDLACENIAINKLLGENLQQVVLPKESVYKMAKADTTERSDRDRQSRNSQLRPQWDTKRQKVIEAYHMAGILCGERPWTISDQRSVSFLCLIVGTEG